MSFKILGISTSTDMYLLRNFDRIIMGGDCMIQDLMFCKWGLRARALEKGSAEKL